MPSLNIKHQLTENVKLLHKVALVANDKVLILKRAEDATSRPGKWDLPGGNCEWPNSLNSNQINPHQVDISREIKEETGIEIAPVEFDITKLAYFATYFEYERQLYSVNCGWIVSLGKEFANHNHLPPVSISSEHVDYKWITLDQLDQYDFGGPERDYETAIIRQALS
jgi:8-oxo-dGTP pyrophosphatase MutT (NUDIX family)